MIPELPTSVGDMERLEFYDKLLGNLEDQSTLHEKWHTHRSNPSVCWICDLISLSRKILYTTEQFLSKSTLDSKTVLSSEDDSELESDIENPSDFDIEKGYNEPEFNVIDDTDGDTEESDQ